MYSWLNLRKKNSIFQKMCQTPIHRGAFSFLVDMAVINSSERKLAKRISVHYLEHFLFKEFFENSNSTILKVFVKILYLATILQENSQTLIFSAVSFVLDSVIWHTYWRIKLIFFSEICYP